MSNPPAGWYPDPTGQPNTIRWWDGTQWTGRTEVEDAQAPDDEGDGSGGGDELDDVDGEDWDDEDEDLQDEDEDLDQGGDAGGQGPHGGGTQTAMPTQGAGDGPTLQIVGDQGRPGSQEQVWQLPQGAGQQGWQQDAGQQGWQQDTGQAWQQGGQQAEQGWAQQPTPVESGEGDESGEDGADQGAGQDQAGQNQGGQDQSGQDQSGQDQSGQAWPQQGDATQQQGGWPQAGQAQGGQQWPDDAAQSVQGAGQQQGGWPQGGQQGHAGQQGDWPQGGQAQGGQQWPQQGDVVQGDVVQGGWPQGGQAQGGQQAGQDQGSQQGGWQQAGHDQGTWPQQGEAAQTGWPQAGQDQDGPDQDGPDQAGPDQGGQQWPQQGDVVQGGWPQGGQDAAQGGWHGTGQDQTGQQWSGQAGTDQSAQQGGWQETGQDHGGQQWPQQGDGGQPGWSQAGPDAGQQGGWPPTGQDQGGQNQGGQTQGGQYQAGQNQGGQDHGGQQWAQAGQDLAQHQAGWPQQGAQDQGGGQSFGPPLSPAFQRPEKGGKKRGGRGGPKLPLIIAGAAALVMIVVLGVWAVFGRGGDDPSTNPTPTAQTSGGQTTGQPTSQPTPGQTSKPSVPTGQSRNPALHAGNRIASDAISFPRLSVPWSDRKRFAEQIINSHGQYVLLQPKFDGKNDWYASIFVGALSTAVLYNGDVQATANDLAASLRQAYYSPVSVTAKAAGSGGVKRNGRPGWVVRQQITVNQAKKPSAPVMILTVGVFDLGDGSAVAFVSDIPANRKDLMRSVNYAYSGVKVG